MKENLEQSRQRDKEFSSLEQNGILARNDLLKVQLQTSNIELSLADAESNWRLANINIDIMLGLPEKTNIVQDIRSSEKKQNFYYHFDFTGRGGRMVWHQ